MTQPVVTRQGSSPVILGLPHTGTFVPEELWQKLNAEGRNLRDTDWHVDRLYDGLLGDATTVRATFHRYVIDANRDPSGKSLYPGQNTTGLVPLGDFDNRPIWEHEPDDDGIAWRLALFHKAYHSALAAEIDRVLALHDVVVLYDCHSIRSVIPRLFEGELPIFNIGTNGGASCAPQVEAITTRAARQSGLPWVANGRFKGGWITRRYGNPANGVDAIQMELACRFYMDESPDPVPAAYSPERAAAARHWLHALLDELCRWASG